MKHKHNLLFFFFLIVLIPFSYANYDYNETGNWDSYYSLGTGFFNEELTSIDTFVRSIGNPKQTPLVSDLDGDGINEIIILDSNNIRLYQNKELDIVDSYGITASTYFSNMIIYDIDNDGFNEIIIAGVNSEILHIIEYNGTVIKNQTEYSLAGYSHTSNGEMALKCRNIEQCLLLFSDDDDHSGAGTGSLLGVGFNSTNISSQVSLLTADQSQTSMCFPKIKSISANDYDGDNSIEYIFTTIEVYNNGDDDIQILWISQNNELVPSLEQTKEITSPSNLVGSGLGCINGIAGNYFTSPLVFDIDGSTSNGNEVVVGFMVDSDEFKMDSYKANSDFLDDYPELFQSDGVLIGNVLRADIFDTGENAEFCVMGYDDIDQEIVLLCGSEQNTKSYLGIPYESREFLFDIEGMYNITQSYDNYNVITHSAQHSQEDPYSEIVNSYGVFQIDYDTTCRVQIPPIRCLDLIYENPKGDSALISVDVEKINREQLLVLTSTNLWYLSDKWSNNPPDIPDPPYSNPALDATWKVNTTVEIRSSPIDVDGDLVQTRAILYYGHSNEEDSGWRPYVASGTTNSFSFVANETISSGTLRIIARDNYDNTTNVTLDKIFSVALDGISFGEAITSEGTVEEEEVSELNETTTLTDNKFRDSIVDIANLTGIPVIIFLLLIMLGVNLILIMALWRFPFVAVLTAFIMNFFIVLIASLMGLLGLAISISFYALFLIAGGLYITWIYNKVTGGV